MRTVYIADDGTEFDDDFECEKYEYKCDFKNNNIIILDREGEILDSSDDINFNFCHYIKVKSFKDLDILQKIYEYNEFNVPNDIGEFYYDDESDYWYLIDDKIEELNDELNKLKNIKYKLNNNEKES